MTIQQILSSAQTAQRTHATAERAVGITGVVLLGGLSVLAYSVGVISVLHERSNRPN